MKVLLVEDDAELSQILADGLRQRAMSVDLSHDGMEAVEMVESNTYDVVVLDRDLPVLSGDDVCGSILAREKSPRVLMLTAAASLEDRVGGLTLGADDYLSKPFAFDELVARIHALARRPSRADPPILRAGNLVFDVARRRVYRDGCEIRLTAKEYGVLEVIMRAGGNVVSAEQLLDRAWDENIDPFTATVRVTTAKLRRKLGDPPIIETVIGAGYRVVEAPS